MSIHKPPNRFAQSSSSTIAENDLSDSKKWPEVLNSDLGQAIKKMQQILNSFQEKWFDPNCENSPSIITVEDTLTEIFGQNLVGKVVNITKWDARLQKIHIIQFLALIGHCVTYDSLKEFLYKLQKEENLWLCRLFNIESEKIIGQKIEDLPKDILINLLDIFRNSFRYLNLAQINKDYSLSAALVSFLESHGNLLINNKYFAYEKLENRMRDIENIHQKVNKKYVDPRYFYALHEELAKTVAFAIPETLSIGMIIKIYNYEHRQNFLYLLRYKFCKGGINLYLFEPIKTFEIDDETKEKNLNPKLPSIIIFRGTSDAQSVSRDVEMGGVGYNSFEKYQKILLELLGKVKTDELYLYGHSLGGTDAQRMLLLILENLSKLYVYPKVIKLFAFCSPKLDLLTGEKLTQQIINLKSRNKRPALELHFIENRDDIIAWAGEKNPFVLEEIPDFLKIYFLLFKSNGTYRGPHIHTTFFYQKGKLNLSNIHSSYRYFELGEEIEILQILERLKSHRYNDFTEDGHEWREIIPPEDIKEKLQTEINEKKETASVREIKLLKKVLDDLDFYQEIYGHVKNVELAKSSQQGIETGSKVVQYSVYFFKMLIFWSLGIIRK